MITFKRIFEYVDYWASKMPSHTALLFNDYKISYSQLWNDSIAFAYGLIQLGLTKNSMLLYSMDCCPEFFNMYLGASMVGVKLVGLNSRSPYVDIKKTIEDIKPHLIITDRKDLLSCDSSLFRKPILSIYDTIFKPTNSFHSPTELNLITNSVTEDDIVFIIATSGTTGISKYVPITHKNIIASSKFQAIEFGAPLGANEYDIYQHQVPVNHVSGAIEWGFAPFITGSSILITRNFNPIEVLSNTEKHHVTFLAGVPTMWEMMFKTPNFKSYDLSSVRWCMSGAAMINEELVKRIFSICGKFANPLGMTETSGFCTGFFENCLIENSPNYVGKVFSNIEYMILNEKLSKVKNGEIGQIAYKGDAIVHNYLTSDIKHQVDGYFLSGDMVYEDFNKNIFLVGRQDEMFTVGGYNVFPQEIERIVLNFKGINQAVVMPIPHTLMGHVCRLYIVLDNTIQFDLEQFRQYMEQTLIYYKIPRDIKIVKILPMNSFGKIKRSVLKNQILQEFSNL